MANAALVPIDALTCAARGRRNSQTHHPGRVIGIDVQHASLGIDCRTAPFGAAGKARNVDGQLVEARGNELSPGDHRMELLDRPRMCFGSAIGKRVLGHALLGIGSG